MFEYPPMNLSSECIKSPSSKTSCQVLSAGTSSVLVASFTYPVLLI